jgi:hypothetical protein
MVYQCRPGSTDDPGAVLAVMRGCRHGLIRASMTVEPKGPSYRGLDVVGAATNAVAGLPVGRENSSWATVGGAAEGQRQRITADRASESGRVLNRIDVIGRLP